MDSSTRGNNLPVWLSARFAYAIACGVAFGCFIAWDAQAATLSLGPGTGVFSLSETITLDVQVNSPGESVNAASATLAFPQDVLAVQSVSKTGSIIDWWTIEPSFSNTKGTVTFEGVALKGFSGSRGTALKITFKALKEGDAVVSFSSGSLLANDGSGNNIATAMEKARLTVRGVLPVKKFAANASAALENETKKVAGAEEFVAPAPARPAEKAQLNIVELARKDRTAPRASFKVQWVRGVSADNTYEVHIDGEPRGMWRDDGTHVYSAPLMGGGLHALVLKAETALGETVVASAPFEIVPLQAPVIQLGALSWKRESPVVIGLAPYPYAAVRMILKDKEQGARIYEGRAGMNGEFTLRIDTSLPYGVYTARVEVVDGRGARSMLSNTVVVPHEGFVPSGLMMVIFAAATIIMGALAYGLVSGRKEEQGIAAHKEAVVQ